eukprot:CAMPEP_0183292000 /NCGR_PEP_ID=MMETSP0160_2-20130417/1229_1 /TAXON_ID=2839 ORGANISM="Odontella Sinensis, Strain Grunow 1884" /NCGR_SAMPLE_ID=MMETSP0160_2 /ASSEMBLY_ACC=CAM_ASM_000250 /LENGTH=189 /DNA_ID=CAMNT_0025452893 /DNA_START=117 /DNA_END=682 /DNA_ORIENTATION=-
MRFYAAASSALLLLTAFEPAALPGAHAFSTSGPPSSAKFAGVLGGGAPGAVPTGTDVVAKSGGGRSATTTEAKSSRYGGMDTRERYGGRGGYERRDVDYDYGNYDFGRRPANRFGRADYYDGERERGGGGGGGGMMMRRPRVGSGARRPPPLGRDSGSYGGGRKNSVYQNARSGPEWASPMETGYSARG